MSLLQLPSPPLLPPSSCLVKTPADDHNQCPGNYLQRAIGSQVAVDDMDRPLHPRSASAVSIGHSPYTIDRAKLTCWFGGIILDTNVVGRDFSPFVQLLQGSKIPAAGCRPTTDGHVAQGGAWAVAVVVLVPTAREVSPAAQAAQRRECNFVTVCRLKARRCWAGLT